MRSVVGMIEEQGLAPKRAAMVFVYIGQFMDQVLLAMVRTHESTSHEPAVSVASNRLIADMEPVGEL